MHDQELNQRQAIEQEAAKRLGRLAPGRELPLDAAPDLQPKRPLTREIHRHEPWPQPAPPPPTPDIGMDMGM